MGDGPYMRDEPGVAHNRATLGISTRGRDTGDAQIFVNLIDSPRLDHAYTVFAVVERGMDVADTVLEGDVMAKVEFVDAPRR
jgi:cyclophilin family peptidyl-prolyl cis-trans isomerase